MVDFGLLPAKICWRVWGTPANFNGFRVLAAFLHGILVIMVAPWNKADRYIFILWFLSSIFFPRLMSAVADWMSTILRHMVWP